MTAKILHVAALVDAYESGKSTTEIAAMTGLSASSVRHRLVSAGVRMRTMSDAVSNSWKTREPKVRDIVYCSIPGCDRPVYARSWCNSHWQRYYRHGSPTAGKEQPWAREEPYSFFNDVVLQHREDACLLWPYSSHDYPQLGHKYAHRLVCEAEHGPPPSSRHHAAHSCGNSLCVARLHLSWKTPRENSADKIKHGTASAGDRNPMAKLTRENVVFIRASQGSQTAEEMAARFGVTPGAIRRVLAGKQWRQP